MLDIVIVTYRNRELVAACLDSLRKHPPASPVGIFIIDNASGDGTVELIRQAYPNVNLTASSANVGFAAATNHAIRQGTGTYVLALNPDTRVTPGALDTLLDLMEAHPEVGICGCRLIREDGSFDHAARRSFPTIAGSLGHFLRIGRSSRVPAALSQYRAPTVERGPVDAVNGAFMLMRRRALEDVGLFDEGYWMYMEDLDLCYRFAQGGWTTWYEPSVTVVHVKHGSSGSVRSARLNYAFHYGMARFYRKHYAASRSRLVNAAVYAGIAAKFAVSTTRAEATLLLRRARRLRARRALREGLA
jgi:N-acetylglucosaminyl-diphospho-decaprenol L-rhamnosyltransferase